MAWNINQSNHKTIASIDCIDVCGNNTNVP
jgi:hypothetical protein